MFCFGEGYLLKHQGDFPLHLGNLLEAFRIIWAMQPCTFLCSLEIQILFQSVIIGSINVNKWNRDYGNDPDFSNLNLCIYYILMFEMSRNIRDKFTEQNHHLLECFLYLFIFSKCTAEASHHQQSTCGHKVKIKCWIPNGIRIPTSLILTLTCCLHRGYSLKQQCACISRVTCGLLCEIESP